MEIKQFINLQWTNGVPFLLLYDSNKNEMEYFELTGNLNITRLNEKKCKGYYDLELHRNIPCEMAEMLSDHKFNQCKRCEQLSGFLQCLGCNGSECRTNNKKARDFCENNHFVYLAYFEKDIFKVGTAVEYRKYERLLEQGALYSIFIAKTPTGRLARLLEANIANQGYTSRVNISRKAKNLILTADKNDIHIQLIKRYHEICRDTVTYLNKYFIEPEVNDFSQLSEQLAPVFVEECYQMDLFGNKPEPLYKEYDIISNPKSIVGNIIGVIGGLLVVKNNEAIQVFNLKSLAGWMISISQN